MRNMRLRYYISGLDTLFSTLSRLENRITVKKIFELQKLSIEFFTINDRQKIPEVKEREYSIRRLFGVTQNRWKAVVPASFPKATAWLPQEACL